MFNALPLTLKKKRKEERSLPTSLTTCTPRSRSRKRGGRGSRRREREREINESPNFHLALFGPGRCSAVLPIPSFFFLLLPFDIGARSSSRVWRRIASGTAKGGKFLLLLFVELSFSQNRRRRGGGGLFWLDAPSLETKKVFTSSPPSHGCKNFRDKRLENVDKNLECK